MLLGSWQKRCHISSETSNISSMPWLSTKIKPCLQVLDYLTQYLSLSKIFFIVQIMIPLPVSFFPHNYNFQVIMKTATALNSFWRITLTSVTKMIGKKELINLYKINLMIVLICWKFYCYKEEPKNNHKTNLMEEKVDSAHTFFFFSVQLPLPNFNSN